MDEHGLWDVGSSTHSLCVWAWELTSLTEHLPLENGITVLTLQSCYKDYVNVGGSVPSLVLDKEWLFINRSLMPFISALEEGGVLSQHQPLPPSPLPSPRKTSHIPFLSPLLL